jgi:hypothetical protein
VFCKTLRTARFRFQDSEESEWDDKNANDYKMEEADLKVEQRDGGGRGGEEKFT